MILAIDMGNTNTVIGGIDEKKTYFIERVTTDQNRTDTEYAVSFKNILEMCGIDVKDIEGAILSSVVPPLNSVILSAVEKVTGIRPLLVGSGMKTGMNILMDNPKAVGSDQIVDAVAASHDHPLPLIVIDMGTATKITAVDEQGTVQGVSIMPGVFISLDALVNGTSLLKGIATNAPVRAIGKNTVESMQSGVVFGAASMLDGMVERFEAELGPAKTLVATGGAAGIVVPHCRHSVQYVPTLILDGLYAVYCRTHAAL